MIYMLVCVFYPLAALCLCSPLLIVIPVTVLLSVVWETTRRQHWSHVSSLTRQFHHGQRMWSSSPRQCSTFSIDGNDWEGECPDRVGVWKPKTPQPQKHILPGRRTHLHTVSRLRFSQIPATSETSRTNVTDDWEVLLSHWSPPRLQGH